MVYGINSLLGFIYFIISYCGIIFLLKKNLLKPFTITILDYTVFNYIFIIYKL